MLWHIWKWFLFLSPCWEHDRIFLGYSLRETGRILGDKTQQKCGFFSHDWVPLEFFSLRFVPTERNLSITVQVSLSWHWLPQWFQLVGFCFSNLWFSVLPFQSLQFGDSGLPCDHTSFTNLRRVVYFFSLFSLLLVRMEWQMPTFYMLDQKPEVPSCPFYFILLNGLNFWYTGTAMIWMFVFPSNSYVEILTHIGDGIGRLGFLEVLKSWEWTPHEWISGS